MNATTPVCRSCGTKFPGRESCKCCGSDPHADPSVAMRVTAALLDVSDRPRRRALKRSMTQTPKRRKHGRR